jgi:hypothetical protein
MNAAAVREWRTNPDVRAAWKDFATYYEFAQFQARQRGAVQFTP